MNYYLMFHIDKDGTKGIVLKDSTNLFEMDNYIIHNFRNSKEVIKKFESDNFIVVNDYDYIKVSSTEIRNNLSSKYLDNRVLKYIIDNNLYK